MYMMVIVMPWLLAIVAAAATTFAVARPSRVSGAACVALGAMSLVGGIGVRDLVTAATAEPQLSPTASIVAGAAALLAGGYVALTTRSDETRQTTVKCPFCAEAIQPEAVVCKHCGRDLNLKASSGVGSPYRNESLRANVAPASEAALPSTEALGAIHELRKIDARMIEAYRDWSETGMPGYRKVFLESLRRHGARIKEHCALESDLRAVFPDANNDPEFDALVGELYLS